MDRSILLANAFKAACVDLMCSWAASLMLMIFPMSRMDSGSADRFELN